MLGLVKSELPTAPSKTRSACERSARSELGERRSHGEPPPLPRRPPLPLRSHILRSWSQERPAEADAPPAPPPPPLVRARGWGEGQG